MGEKDISQTQQEQAIAEMKKMADAYSNTILYINEMDIAGENTETIKKDMLDLSLKISYFTIEHYMTRRPAENPDGFENIINPFEKANAAFKDKTVNAKYDLNSSPEILNLIAAKYGKELSIKLPAYNFYEMQTAANTRLAYNSNARKVVKKCSNVRYFVKKDFDIAEDTYIADGNAYMHPSTCALRGNTTFEFNARIIHNFRRIISKDENMADAQKEILYSNLAECEILSHDFRNISLIPAFGRLITRKSYGLRVDDHYYNYSDNFEYINSPCTYAYLLNRFFENNDEDIIGLMHRNNTEIKNFLKQFDNVTDYCHTMMFIPEIPIECKLITDMIKLGEHPIETTEQIIEYMDLFNRYISVRK